MRRPFIAGNWKMNKTISEGLVLVKELKEVAEKTDVEVAVCVPFIALKDIKEEIKDSKIKLGAQNMHWEESGAFTGEISPVMLKDIGVDYVIIGHSERRQYFNETDETVNKKIKSALKHEINPIVCVGETLEEREKGIEKDIVKNQVLKAFDGVEKDDVTKIVIAYEPIWAIGTGKTASSEDANEMCAFIRKTIEEKYGIDVSERVRIQYGGSVKPHNVTDIMNQADIDGALVGGASLKADAFTEIVNF
ncbi:triose-phosphate isomerase [Thermohalobacter berrensis]|uniref:Triosephosphate isomerase n=1 Tax=Thermohalobacter berrensis TaxID=99594 RepID=A0A419SV73_9FIRM|nr:triose-phosphate isomerase [Thermohalobacter berrensis]RKD29113.1 triose-phosphate isomerase [Thermohalobacter berrensis]